MPNFWRNRLFVNMPITNEDKFLIKTFFTPEGYNTKQIVRQIAEAVGYWVGRPADQHQRQAM